MRCFKWDQQKTMIFPIRLWVSKFQIQSTHIENLFYVPKTNTALFRQGLLTLVVLQFELNILIEDCNTWCSNTFAQQGRSGNRCLVSAAFQSHAPFLTSSKYEATPIIKMLLKRMRKFHRTLVPTWFKEMSLQSPADLIFRSPNRVLHLYY